MHLMRYLLSCLVISLIVAISSGGVAMAANDLGHQTHCMTAVDETSHDTNAKHTHNHAHDHDGLVTQHAAPEHDHETCMMHACPALFADATFLAEAADTLLAKLSWPEQPLLALERADGLKRPPKS